MTIIRFAVVGCGNIAQRNSIPALMKSGITSISVCIDTNSDKEKEISEQFNLPFANSFENALLKYTFDAVYIATPTGAHKNLIIKAANNKKHILCEKSLAPSLEDIIEITNVCKFNKVALFEGFMYQFHTQHKWVKDFINSGEIGFPFHFHASFGFPPLNKDDFRYKKELGGGAVLDAGAYLVHCARHFFKEEPNQIFSILSNEDAEIEIRGTVLLGFSEGKTAQLVFGFNNSYQNTYKIWGTNGLLSLTRAFALPEDFCSTVTIEKQEIKEEIKMDACNHFIEEIKYFCSNLNNSEQIENWYNESILQGIVLSKIASSINEFP